MTPASAAEASVWYVKAGAQPEGDGTSWNRPFADLQSALDAAGTEDQIWLTRGTYKPSQRTDPDNPRTATFLLSQNVTIFGGFAGTETDPDHRNPAANRTILTGDIGLADDDSDNSYHVIKCLADAHIHDLVITKATANQGLEYGSGGGFYCENSSPTVTGCTFTQNYAHLSGAAVFSKYSDITVSQCIFENNRTSTTAAASGAAISIAGASAAITRCFFIDNTAALGGAISARDSILTVTNSLFAGNHARGYYGWAGAIFNSNAAEITITNSLFYGNTAVKGGAFYSLGQNTRCYIHNSILGR